MAWSNRKHVPTHMRRRILDRDNHTCQHCGDQAAEVDHIHNDATGGTTTYDNLQSLCAACHERKTRRETKIGHQRRRAAGHFPGERHPGLL